MKLLRLKEARVCVPVWQLNSPKSEVGRGGWSGSSLPDIWLEIANQAKGMCCEIFTVIGKRILCDKRVCCVPGIVSKQQPELSSAAFTTWVFLDRFPFKPIRTRNRHRRLPELT